MGNSRCQIITMAVQVPGFPSYSSRSLGRSSYLSSFAWAPQATILALVLVTAVSVVIASGEANSNSTINRITTVENLNLSLNQQENRSQHVEQLERQLLELRYRYETNRAIKDRPYYCLLAVYSLLMLIGTIFNSLILFTVVLRPSILSPRNIFVVNLAASDLLLCVFTMPFSFIEISMKMWQLGLLPCKLVAGLQATSIFVSTISITAIALDRYKVIVYPTQQEAPSTRRRDMLILASVWALALTLSLPLFCFRTVRHMDLPHKYETTLKAVDYCIEEWPFNHGRGIYSVISMIFQYVLPISIVSVVYAKISKRLQKRLIRRQQQLTQSECKQKRQLNLIKRTHTMLVSVSLVFGLSWLPLNLLNVIGDFTDLFTGDTADEQKFRVVFAICHLIGCLSACTNPILYAYLNDNFRKEALVAYGYQLNRLARLLNLKTSTTPGHSQHYRRSPETHNACGFGPDQETSKRLRSGPLEQSVVSLQPGHKSPESNHQPPPNSSRLSTRLSTSSSSSNSTTTSTTNSTSNNNSNNNNTTTSSTCSTSGGSNQELTATCDNQRGESVYDDRNQRLENSQQQWLTLATNLRPGGSHVVLNLDKLQAPSSQQQQQLAPSANGLDACTPTGQHRRCSFQTSAASSGGGGQHHHHLGTTMRLCLCISRTSSESQVVAAGTSDGQPPQRLPQVPDSGRSGPGGQVMARASQQQRCPCQCHHNNKLGVTTTPTMRSRSSSQTSSLVVATATALATSAAVATAKVGELRRKASKLLVPLGVVSTPSVAKHSTGAATPANQETLAQVSKKQRHRRRRVKRTHRHQNHCSACRDNHQHHKRHRKQRRRENQHGADDTSMGANGVSDLGVVAAPSASPTKEGKRSASMARLGGSSELEVWESSTMTKTMTITTTATSANQKFVTGCSCSALVPISVNERKINKVTNNKAPGETMSFQEEAAVDLVVDAMRRQLAANEAANGDATADNNLDEDCDCSHSSSLQASCHLYSHSSSCTCSCRSSFSCPFMQHLGRSLAPGQPPMPLVAPSATITTTTITSPFGALGQLRRKVSWRAGRGTEAAEDLDGISPFMHLTRDTCSCSTSTRLKNHQAPGSCCCSPLANSPTTSCGEGSCEQSVPPPNAAQQRPPRRYLTDRSNFVIGEKGFMDEPTLTTSTRRSATTKIACNGLEAYSPPSPSDLSLRGTSGSEDTTSSSSGPPRPN